MALSATAAGFNVGHHHSADGTHVSEEGRNQGTDESLQGVSHFLDTVQIDPEGRYGYEVQKKAYQISVTAMAQLCRIYLGRLVKTPHSREESDSLTNAGRMKISTTITLPHR